MENKQTKIEDNIKVSEWVNNVETKNNNGVNSSFQQFPLFYFFSGQYERRLIEFNLKIL